MLKGQDVVVLLALVGAAESWSTQRLADRLHLSPATTHRAVHSLMRARLYDRDRARVPEAAAEEFLIHAVKFVFPAERGSETRGVPTAWAGPPLAAEVADDNLPPVWPHPQGERRGIALEPLHQVVPDLALEDHRLWERLALVDAIRAGNARVRRLAEEALVADLRSSASR